MSIKFRLDEVLQERGQSAYSLSKQTNIAESVLWRMRHAKTQGVQWDTLNRICEALNCTPGDLIVYVPDTESVPISIAEAKQVTKKKLKNSK
jgi:putative transcriptional regulator